MKGILNNRKQSSRVECEAGATRRKEKVQWDVLEKERMEVAIIKKSAQTDFLTMVTKSGGHEMCALRR